MSVSYAFSVAELVIAGIAAYYIFVESNLWLLIGVTPSPVILLLTFNFRYSRTILLHYFRPASIRGSLKKMSFSQDKNLSLTGMVYF